MQVQEYLTSQQVPFREILHPAATQASRVAHAIRAPEDGFAKTVVLIADGRPLLAVVPASAHVHMKKLKRALGVHHLTLATEPQCQQIFNESEPGAWPPFGSLHHVPTVLDDTLATRNNFVFESNDHRHAIEMKLRDFEAVEHPRHLRFAKFKNPWRDDLFPPVETPS